MNKKAPLLIGIMLAFAAFSTSTVTAQTTIASDTSAHSEVDSGGGLGSGLNHMVRSILGDTEQPQVEAQTVIAPAAMMMKVNGPADTRLAPQPQTMSRKATAVFSASGTMNAMTDEDLHAYIVQLMHEDSHIQSVDSADTHVRITYTVSGKMFRFMPVSIKITASAYASGGTDVTLPWYAFATSGNLSDFKIGLNNRVEPLIVSDSFTLEDQKVLIDAIHVSLLTQFGTSQNVSK